MGFYNCSSVFLLNDWLSKYLAHSGSKEPEQYYSDFSHDLHRNLYSFEELEDVFPDHLILTKRLRQSLYSGDLNGTEDLPEYPPMALTSLALQLFSEAVPNYGLEVLDMDYVSSTSKSAQFSPCAMILAMMYLDRLKLTNSKYLDTVSPSGLFVVTMLVASKFLFEDGDVTNQMWAQELNYDVEDLNSLERNFLSAIDWRIFVASAEYYSYLKAVEKELVLRESSARSWLSYNEILILIEDADFRQKFLRLMEKIVKVIVVWIFGYAATVLATYYVIAVVTKFSAEKMSQELVSSEEAVMKCQLKDGFDRTDKVSLVGADKSSFSVIYNVNKAIFNDSAIVKNAGFSDSRGIKVDYLKFTTSSYLVSKSVQSIKLYTKQGFPLQTLSNYYVQKNHTHFSTIFFPPRNKYVSVCVR